MSPKQVTLQQLRNRLAGEKHLTWVFFQCLNRTDAKDRAKSGAFHQEGNTVWTGFWNEPAVKYDRIAHWNDQSQILYIGNQSDKRPKLVDGDRRKTIEDFEAFEIVPKLGGKRNLSKIIPEAVDKNGNKSRVNYFTYWPKTEGEYTALAKVNSPKPSSIKPDLNSVEIESVFSAMLQLSLDKEDINEVLKEVWCRTSAHSRFKEKLEAHWGEKCALTGLKTKAFLVASHIKPWAKCRDSLDDQVNKHNGLLLSVPVDKLFDRGFLSFSNSGEVLLHQNKKHARYMSDSVLLMFGLHRLKLPKLARLDKKSYPFLDYHRDHIFNRK